MGLVTKSTVQIILPRLFGFFRHFLRGFRKLKRVQWNNTSAKGYWKSRCSLMKTFHQVEDKLWSLHPSFALAGAHLPPWMGQCSVWLHGVKLRLLLLSLTEELVHPLPTAILSVLWWFCPNTRVLPAGRVWHLSVLLISLNAYTESAQGNLETVLLLLGFLFLNHLNASDFFSWSGEWNTSIPGFVCFAVFGRLNLSQDHSSCCCCAEFPLYDGRAARKQGDRSWGTKAIGHFPVYFILLSHCWSIIIPLICLSLGIISREELRMGECANLRIHHRLGFAVLTWQFLCLLCYRIL